MHGQIHPQTLFSYYLSFNPKKCPIIYAVTLVLPLNAAVKKVFILQIDGGRFRILLTKNGIYLLTFMKILHHINIKMKFIN